MVSSIKLPILKKGKYILWTKKMEQYLAHTDYALWKLILNGNGQVQMIKDKAGNEVEVPHVTAQQVLARTRERKAKITLLMAIPDEHLARFHGIKDAKTLWAPIKTRFGESTSNTNELNAAYSFSTATIHSSQAQGSSSYVDELKFSFFANQSSSPQLDNKDLEQIDQDDLKEIDFKWQVAMLSMRVKRFYKKLGESWSLMKKYQDCRTARNPRNRGRDARNAGYRGRVNGKRPAREEDEKALVVHAGLGTYDWSYQLEEEETDFALMAFTSNPSSSSSTNSEVQSCSKQCAKSYEQLKNLFDKQHKKLKKSNLEIVSYQYGLESIEGQLRVHQQNEVICEEKIRVLEYDVKDNSNLLKYTQKQLDEALREKEDIKAKLEKFETSSKNLAKLLNSQISAKVKTGLGNDSQLNEKKVLDVKAEEVTETVFDNCSSDEENSLANDRRNYVVTTAAGTIKSKIPPILELNIVLDVLKGSHINLRPFIRPNRLYALVRSEDGRLFHTQACKEYT
uniref:Ribonuclease H-like domain-containing protein n=1 Tax=Tanacetum cinerariifolium TaxID=118510 RepID=A0A6L2NMG6_TANCI|nr:ribonuclease H-like domain-containing protein [Tanacetum cinerariifolium]